MKDRHAVTRQWLSLPPPITPEAALALALDDLRVLEAVRHGHKLRTGHVRANRFRLRVRGVGAERRGARAGDPRAARGAARRAELVRRAALRPRRRQRRSADASSSPASDRAAARPHASIA